MNYRPPSARKFLEARGYDIRSVEKEAIYPAVACVHFHKTNSRITPWMRVRKDIPRAKQNWALWHEAAHLLDYPDSTTAQTNCGIVSGPLKKLLLGYWWEIYVWSGASQLALRVEDKVLPIDVIYNDPALMRKLPPDLAADVRKRVKPMRDAYLNPGELFAEAAAAMVCLPGEISRTCPDLVPPLVEILITAEWPVSKL